MGYKDTINWIIHNDDCHWVFDENPIPSITVMLTMDIFNKTPDKITRDIRKKYIETYGDLI